MKFPDPFNEPYEYWLMVVNATNISYDEKIEVLKAVGMTIDKAPKKEAVA